MTYFLHPDVQSTSAQRLKLNIAYLVRNLAFVMMAILGPSLTFAQSDLTDVIGTPIDASMYPVPGVGSVNLNNGNLFIKIPIQELKDRNGGSVATNIIYNNSVWSTTQQQSQSGGMITVWAYAAPSVAVYKSSAYSGFITWQSPTTSCGNSSGQTHTNWRYTDGNGTAHTFSPSLVTGDSSLLSCGYYSTGQGPATDGSGYWIKITNSTTATVYDMHGNSVGVNGKDTNGNVNN